LVDATTGDHIWAEHYDRALRDIFNLQDEIVRRIVTTLNLQLNLTEKGVRVVKRTDNLEAYDYYLRGVEVNQNPTKETIEQARQMFKKAIELDPKYSDAYAGLGRLLLMDRISQWSDDPHALDRSIQLEQQSIALDNSNAFAYAAMSFSYIWTRQDDLAITAAERALALDPNSALGYSAMADALSFSGKSPEALVVIHKAMRLDPRSRDRLSANEGTAYLVMGRYEDAITSFRKYLARYSNQIPTHLLLIACYVELGRNEEARADAEEVMRINPQFSLAMQKQRSLFKAPLRDHLYGDMAKAGLK
jgi:adenylate cyclase